VLSYKKPEKNLRKGTNPPAALRISTPGWEKGCSRSAPLEQHPELFRPSGTAVLSYKKPEKNLRRGTNPPAALRGLREEARSSGVRGRLLAALPGTGREAAHPGKHRAESFVRSHRGACKPPRRPGKAPVARAACKRARELQQQAGSE